jgi:hypothetical protein
MLRPFATTRTVVGVDPEARVGKCPQCGHDALFLRFVDHESDGEPTVSPWYLDHCSGGCLIR